MSLTIADIKPYLLLECIAGSRAYGLATEHSDTDIKGVFYLPPSLYYGLEYVPQVNNDTNDIVYYELGRFVELLLASNPNMLELLNAPPATILFQHPLMAYLKSEWFLSKTCIRTFAHYAQGQIKKAYGLNKKIINPVDKQLKTILDFCYLVQGAGSLPLTRWLAERNWQQAQLGLASIPHARDLYAVYYDATGRLGYQGVLKKPNASNVLVSAIPADALLKGYLSFNQDGYSTYCKSYHAYWQWVQARNEQRHQLNTGHGRDYDSKNMLHVFRLLYMAREIAQTGQIHVFRENRQQLLAIKEGIYDYTELCQQAEQLLAEIEQAFTHSRLPDTVNQIAAVQTLVQIRQTLYQQQSGTARPPNELCSGKNDEKNKN